MQTTPFSSVPAGDLFKRLTGDKGAVLVRTEGNVMLNGNPMNALKLGFAGVLYNIPGTEEVLWYPNERLLWSKGSVDLTW